jgi:hypothetical protein
LLAHSATRKPSAIVLDFQCRSIQGTSLSGNPVLLVVPSNRAEQPADAMGSIAAEQLMKMRSNETVDPSLHIVLKSMLIIRESSEKRISNKS